MYDDKKQSTTMYTACGQCRKGHQGKEECQSVRCVKCGHGQNSCSLCHKSVCGSQMYLWCQGCGHGGHYRCIYGKHSFIFDISEKQEMLIVIE